MKLSLFIKEQEETKRRGCSNMTIHSVVYIKNISSERTRGLEPGISFYTHLSFIFGVNVLLVYIVTYYNQQTNICNIYKHI